MAGGIDWFRWHHGSVTDPKFQLIAKRSGASLPDVLAVWAYLLEQASANEIRGNHGDIDCEAVDCMFGFDDGRTEAILKAMESREMLNDGRVTSWDKRQPKRERDTDNSAERTRAYRERQKQQGDAASDDVTPCDATERQRNARGEKSREESNNPPTPQGGMTRFEDFWSAWPKSERKQDKVKCAQKWRRSNFDAVADAILADIAIKQQTQKWQEGYIEAPLVYLNGKRWEDGVTPAGDEQAASTVGTFV